MRIPRLLSIIALGTALVACNNKSEPHKPGIGQTAADSASASSVAVESIPRLDFPGTEEGAAALLRGFLEPTANRAEMSKSLRPSDADYDSIFAGDAAGKAKTAYEEHWSKEQYVIEVQEGQTELLLWRATTEQLRDASGDASEFPSGYRKVAEKFKPGLTFYRFKFVKPNDKHGMTYDGLVFVNGHWVMVSKPYRVLD